MADRALIEFRSRVLKGIRDFFHSRHYLEVDTPLLSPRIIPESHLHYYRTAHHYADQDQVETPLFLLPSPELWLKKLLNQGMGPLFEISRAFRNSEERGQWHNPEFTMLEWYTLDASDEENIPVLRDLIRHLAAIPTPGGGGTPSLALPLEVITMAEAFSRWAGIALGPETTREELLSAAAQRDLNPQKDDTWEELFHRIFLTLVEPEIPRDRPVVITRYPRQISTLARVSPEGWACRWELYLGGAEAANCYAEETDRNTISRFFHEQEKERQDDPDFPPSDKELIDEMSRMPRCSGAALGVDRLIAALAGKSSLEGVILFPFADILASSKIKDRKD